MSLVFFYQLRSSDEIEPEPVANFGLKAPGVYMRLLAGVYLKSLTRGNLRMPGGPTLYGHNILHSLAGVNLRLVARFNQSRQVGTNLDHSGQLETVGWTTCQKLETAWTTSWILNQSEPYNRIEFKTLG